jgi:hypothetical protein
MFSVCLSGVPFLEIHKTDAVSDERRLTAEWLRTSDISSCDCSADISVAWHSVSYARSYGVVV